MSKILIGSSALAYWFPDKGITPKDTDYAVEVDEKGTKEVEYLYNPILFKGEYEGHIWTPRDGEYVASPDMLYTLKMSHMFWDVSWGKNIYYIQLMKDLGCKVIRPLFYDLYAFWNEYHGRNKRSDLSMDATSFFNNAIKYPVDHDTLHTLLVDIPTYTKILKEGAEVEVCEEKFNGLSREEKLSLVREEVYIMATERANGMDYRRAYDLMLKKFIQSHAPLWEAVFILHNYKELSRPEFNYIAYLEGRIKELELCN